MTKFSPRRSIKNSIKGSVKVSASGGGGSLPDETPDAFAFTPVSNAVLGSEQISNEITLAGLGSGVSVPVTVNNGLMSKNGGAYTGDPQVGVNGDTFRVKRNASNVVSTTVFATLSAGPVSADFAIQTQATPVGPSVYEGLVANTVWGNDQINANNWNEFGLSVFTATSDIVRVKLALIQMGKSPNTLLIPSGGEYRGVGFEYPIVSGRRNTGGHAVQRMTFGGNNASGTQPGNEVTFTDWLDLGTMVPKGSNFRIWTDYKAAASGGAGMNRSNAAQNDNLGDYYIFTPNNYGDPIGTSTVPDIGTSGSNAKPCKVIAVIAETTDSSIIVIGDSMMMFSSLLGPQEKYGRTGAFKEVPMDVPLLNLGVSSLSAIGASSWRGWSGLWRLLPYCSTLINQLGFNDQANVGNSAFMTEMETLANLATAADKKYVCTITPQVSYSASHKGWTLTTGQSPSTAWTQRDTYNETVRVLGGALAAYTDYLDMAAGFCHNDGRSGIFKISPQARQISPVAYSAGTALEVPGANFVSADVGYGWSCATSVGGGVSRSAWIGSVIDSDSATSGTNPGTSSGTGDFNIGAYTTDGVHPTQPLWDVTIPIVGLDDANTWARAT